MKQTPLYFLAAVFIFFLSSCIGDDVVNDRVDPLLRIMNNIDTLQVGTSHQFELLFLNEVGLEEDVDISWLSEDENIIQINNDGLASAVAIGSTSLTAIAVGRDASIEIDIAVGESTVITEVEGKSGSIVASSFYELVGDFTIDQDGNDLLISFADNYRASTALPGLYVYLTNNPSTTNGALEIGKVTTFQGTHEYLIEDEDINNFSHLLYFCKPFNVKVGDGVIE